jgi:hypothetical protein
MLFAVRKKAMGPRIARLANMAQGETESHKFFFRKLGISSILRPDSVLPDLRSRSDWINSYSTAICRPMDRPAVFIVMGRKTIRFSCTEKPSLWLLRREVPRYQRCAAGHRTLNVYVSKYKRDFLIQRLVRHLIFKKSSLGFMLGGTGFQFAAERSFDNEFIVVTLFTALHRQEQVDTFYPPGYVCRGNVGIKYPL